MRALAVKVNAASTAGGFILPNDRVDVILISSKGNRDTQSETILSNVRVLAVDQTVEGDGSDQKPVMVAQDTVTLELNPSQAELITQAQQSGTIFLSLRSIEDTAVEAEPAPRPAGVSLVKFGISSRVSARETPDG
jgi:pilus assembly protein CpaB